MAFGKPFTEARATTVRVDSIEAVAEEIKGISDNPCKCWCPGGSFADYSGDQQQFDVMAATVMRKHMNLPAGADVSGIQEINNRDYIARIKSNMHASRIQLFDYDQADGMPDKFRNMDADSLVAFMRGIFGEDVGFVAVESTSGRVKGTNKAKGWHLYAIIKDPTDLSRFKSAWLAQGFIHGWSFLKPTHCRKDIPDRGLKAGDVCAYVPWSLFDPSVLASCERLDFIGKPYAPDGSDIEVLPATTKVYEGIALDTAVIASIDAQQREVVKKTLKAKEITLMGNDGFCTSVVGGIELITSIETEAGDMTMREFWESEHKKLRSQIPVFIRDSDSWNGILRMTEKNTPMFYDNGTQTKYFLSEEDVGQYKKAHAITIMDEVIEKLKEDPKCEAHFDDNAIKAAVYLKNIDPKLCRSYRRSIKRYAKNAALVNWDDDIVDTLKEEKGEMGGIAGESEIADAAIGKIGSDSITYHEATGFMVWHSHSGYWRGVTDALIGRRAVLPAIKQALDDEETSCLVGAVTNLMRVKVAASHLPGSVLTPHVINTANCELHYENDGWVRKPHDKSMFRTAATPYSYDPMATCPIWDKSVRQMLAGFPDVEAQVVLLEAMIGLTLTTSASTFEKFIYLYGPGGNGKSVILAVVKAVVGANACSAVQMSEMDNRFQLASMHGKLANLITEVGVNDVLPDDVIKSLVSGETKTVEHKNKPPFEMESTATLWFAANHQAAVRDYSDAFFQRAIVFHLPHTFRGTKNEDLTLKHRIVFEAQGIFNRALAAYTNILRDGIILPASVVENVRTWRREADQVLEFAEDALVIKPNGGVTQSELYNTYLEWCQRVKGNKRHMMGQKALNRRLERIEGVAITGQRGSGNKAMARGIDLKHKLPAALGGHEDQKPQLANW